VPVICLHAPLERTPVTASTAVQRGLAAVSSHRSGPARIGVVTFPGSLDDHDARRAVERAGAQAVALWHGDADLHGVDAVILPGGFSYGDYLRCGAIARFAPVMTQLIPAASDGLPVLGICNGFQILCEAHLLPGALTRNVARRFINREVTIRIENAATAWTGQFEPGQEIGVVLKSGEGAYVADPEALAALQARGQVLARYVGGSPNGSVADIAGVANENGNVVGLMPHPEHAIDALTGPGEDGLGFFASVLRHLMSAGAIT
jgi:phosphoribosylformylglycinamidine synthase subunit PurQ / glutaminase